MSKSNYDMKTEILQRNKVILRLMIYAAVFLPSCERKEADTPVREKIGLKMEYTAGRQIPPSNGGKQIENINVFFYDNNGILADAVYSDTPEEVLPAEIFNGREYRILAIANTGRLTSMPGIHDIDTLKAAYWNTAGGTGSNGSVVMSGETPPVILENGMKVSVPLRRGYAKFIFTADTSGLNGNVTDFEIKEIRIRQVNSRINFFAPSAASGSKDVTETGEYRKGAMLDGLFSTGVDFYVPENMQGDLLEGNTDESAHIPPAPYDRLCTYVEFIVNYRSNEHHDPDLVYRYYLHDGTRLDNFDIERNRIYTCRTVFTGDGLSETSWRIDTAGMTNFVTGISVYPENVSVYETDTLRLSAVIRPSDATDKRVVWVSENERIAKVSENGLVTGVSPGVSTVTAISPESGISASSKITVIDRTFSLLGMPSVLYPGHNTPMLLQYTADPDGIPVSRVITVSGAEGGLSVSGDVISAHNPENIRNGKIGNYLLRSTLNGITRSRTFEVNTGEIKIDTDPLKMMYIGMKYPLRTTVLVPYDAMVYWSTAQKGQAEFNIADGTVRPLTTGNIGIKASLVSGACDETYVNILSPLLSIESKLEVKVGESVRIKINSTPETGAEIGWVLEPGEEEYGTISPDGVFTCYKYKPATVNVRAYFKEFPEIYIIAEIRILRN